MNNFTYSLISLLFFLPQSIMAQEELTIIENGETQTVTGTLITISDNEEYINTETKLYQVTNKSTVLLGDVVKDNIINIHDVTAIVDMILTNAYSIVADINEDDIINIHDVTDEVDTVLGVLPQKQFVESYVVENITNIWIKNNEATAVDQH